MTMGEGTVAVESSLIVDGSAGGILAVRGSERLRWLNGILTCDVGGLVPGEGTWGLLLNRQGKILSDVSVLAGPEAAFVGVQAGTAPALASLLDRLLVMEDAEISDETADRAWISVHGPAAAAAVAKAAARLDGAFAGRLDWLGIGGGVLVVPRPLLAESIEALRATGSDLHVASPEAFDRLRLEHAWPKFGVDYGTEDNPHQAGLDHRAVSWTKGCYLGQEVVCMADMRGKVRRRSALIVFEQPTAPPAGSAVELAAGGGSIGEVTTSAVSDRFRCGLALARVSRAAVDARAAVIVAGLPGRLAETL